MTLVKSIKVRDIGTKKETKIVEFVDGRVVYSCPFVDFINQTLKPGKWGTIENVMCAAIRDHMTFNQEWLERWRTRVE